MTTAAPASAVGNDTFDHYGMSKAEVIILTFLSGGISFVGSISNILLIVAVLLTRGIRERFTAILLISLSLCDVFICAVYVPLYIYDINMGSSTVLEAVRMRIGFGVFMASLNGELIVTLDRFVYITYPYSYINWTSTNHAAVVAFCVQWLVAVGLTLPLLFTRTPMYSIFYIASLIAVISILHLKMFRVAWRKRQQIAAHHPTGSLSPSTPFWSKSAGAVSMVVLASFLSWAPVVILPMVAPVTKRSIKLAMTFIFLGAASHPFIFCWKLSDFRGALKSCLGKLCNLFVAERWL